MNTPKRMTVSLGARTLTLSLPQLLGIFAVILTLSVIPRFIRAQQGLEGQSLEVSPPTQEVGADPGQTVTVTAKIRNRTAQTEPVSVTIEDFVAKGDEGQVALTETGPWAVSSWTTVSPSEFTLAPNEQKEATATVSIPATGVSGGRYGAFVFGIAGKRSGGQAALSQEVASLFLINVSGPQVEKLSATALSAPPFSEFGPVPLTVTYKNDGNVHLSPYGIITVTDILHRKVADIPVSATNVFPGSNRKVTVRLDKTLLLGPFTATAILYTGGTTNATMTVATNFTVFPVRIAAVLILIIAILYLMRRRLAKALKALAGN